MILQGKLKSAEVKNNLRQFLDLRPLNLLLLLLLLFCLKSLLLFNHLIFFFFILRNSLHVPFITFP